METKLKSERAMPLGKVIPTAKGYLSLLGEWAPPSALAVAVLLGWELFVRFARVPKWLLPAPSGIAEEIITSRQLLLSHTWVTFQEVIVGFAVALVMGVTLAMAIAYSRLLERGIYPFVIASQTIPIIAIAPILLIWFGYGMGPKVIIVALICFFSIVVNMVDGLKSVDPEMLNMMRTLGATRWQVFTKVQIPASLPFLFSGTKIAIAVSVIGAVIGEWVGASAGLGYLMVRSASQFLTARVFASIVVLSIMGILLFVAVAVSERYFLPWYHTEKKEKALA